jgi:DNA-binding NarL/FixJ family response regulator
MGQIGESETNGKNLTRREREVLACLAAGRPAKAAADELGISTQTVAVHRRNAYAKLGIHCVADAVRVAMGITRGDVEG